MTASAVQVHHRVPRYLLVFFDRSREGELDGVGLQAWFDWEEEAFRHGVDPDMSREELAGMVEASATSILAVEHCRRHSEADDFSPWGRRGGLATLERYGRPWFSLLGRRRWGRVGAEALARHRAERLTAKKGAA